MKFVSCLFLIAIIICGGQALIIPEELPSLLSIIYSNIPPIRNGFDTRFGIGFRLGQHADVQLLTEIGPQTETQPFGEAEPQRRRHAPAPPPPSPTKKRKSTPKSTVEVTSELPEVAETVAENVPAPESWLAKWHRSTVNQVEAVNDTQQKVNEPEEESTLMTFLNKLRQAAGVAP